MDVVDVLLWALQVLLGVTFFFAGYSHAFTFERFAARPRMGWANDVGRSNMRIIGLFEIAGGIGVVVPAATGVLPWLTPLAAVGLAGIMALAAVFHVRRGEPPFVNIALLALALVVAVGRSAVVPFG